MKILSLMGKTVNYYKNKGFKHTIKKIWSCLNPFVYTKVIMYHKKLTTSNLGLNDHLNIYIGSKVDINEEYKDIWYTKKQALEKLDKGHILFLAKDGDINIFYCWADLFNINIPCLKVKSLSIPSNVAYLSGAFVIPQYRGRHILKKSLKFIENYLLSKTMVDRIFLVAFPDNIAANRGYLSSGYTAYQYVKYFKIRGFNLYIVGSLADKRPKCRKIFIQNSNFWNAFSSILKGTKCICES